MACGNDAGGGIGAAPDEDGGSTPAETDAGTNNGGESFTVGGTVTGLAGSGLVLEDEGDTVAIASSDGRFVFPRRRTKGATFNVTVKTHPTNVAQTCAVTDGSGTVSADVTNVKVECTTNTYPITVAVAGLAGSGLVLTNNEGDDLPIGPGSVSATFSKKVASGAPFMVAVKAQPGGPPQACTVSGGTGTVVAGPVTTVMVNCTMLYTVGGTITGLKGTGLMLQNNAGEEISVNSNGGFTFLTPAPSGADYAVTVKGNPQTPWQTCTVDEATGKIGTTNVASVAVSCTTDKHAIRGSISGLVGAGLVLQLGPQTLPIAAGGTSFAFDAIESGTSYSILAPTQPTGPSQTCTARTDGTGVVKGDDITTATVVCETNRYVVRVNVTGAVGTGLVLKNNDADPLAIPAAGSYAFAASVASGAAYAVTIGTRPTPSAIKCKVTSAPGTIVDGDVTATVSCVENYVVFVTSARYPGDLGGLTGADTKCRDRASAAGLTGTFKAWLSDGTGSPSTRFTQSTAPYLLVDGTVVADNWTELTSGTLRHAIDKTESGGPAPIEPIFGRAVVWTDTRENGTLYWQEHSCSNWTSTVAAPDNVAILGETTNTQYWSAMYGGSPCDRPSALYCFEQ